MKLHDYLDTLTTAERKKFAEEAKVPPAYLAQLKYASKKGEHRFPSWKICLSFIESSGGKLTDRDLRPDLYDPSYVRPDKTVAA